MDKDTVILSVEDYNRLRDFRKKIEEGYTYRVTYPYSYDDTYISTEDAVKEIHDEYLGQYKRNKELKEEIQELKKHFLTDDDLNEILNMSWWEFRKHKRKLKKELKK